MRLLFALPHVPWPPIGGGRTRSFYLSSLLTSRHEIHVMALRTADDRETAIGNRQSEPHAPRPTPHAPEYASVEIVDIPSVNPPRYSPAWLALRARSLWHPAAAFYRPDVAARLAALVSRHRPDVIVYGMSWMLPYAIAHQAVPGVVDEQNYDPLITERMARGRTGVDALKWKAYVGITARAERRNLKLVRGIAACSETDAAIFRREAPHADVAVVPNGVDLAAYDGAQAHKRTSAPVIVMTGSYSYLPNAEGARRLATRIFPIVRANIPSAELRLVGLSGETVLADLATIPGVTVVGTVDDVRPELERARVAAAPIDTGGGTRLKILEAMAAGLPVVSTHVGAEGIALEPGREVFLRDDDEGFANALIHLLTDGGLAARMGGRGRELVRRYYDWRGSAEAFDSLLARVAA